MAKVKTWVWVVVAIVVVGILGVVAMAAFAMYFFSQHVETTAVSAVTAEQEFDAVKRRFSEQPPLIELDEHGRFLRAHTERPEQPSSPPREIHVLVFDAHDGRIVRVRVPFWLLRLRTGGGMISIDGRRMDLEDLKLTVEDLERFGPTLIVDHAPPSGERVLIWSQ